MSYLIFFYRTTDRYALRARILGLYCHVQTRFDECINNIEIVLTSNNAQVTVNSYGNNKVKIVNNFHNAQNIVVEDSKGRPYSRRTTTSTTSSTSTTTESNSVHDIECGSITPEGIELVTADGGKTVKRGELPWHAGIYSKFYSPYMQICGGSLISTNTIISAAHCFWSDANQLLPAAQFAVGVGKLYRSYNEEQDADAQKSDVADIIIPTRFRGSASKFQDDIALVIVETPFSYESFIRPVCINFDVNFDRMQLTDGNMGKVAGWGLTEKNGKASQVLKVVNLPYVKVEDCYANSPPTFRPYITSDKICAGYTNGTSLCQCDSGGGLAFPAYELGTERYYLRGVTSTAPRNDDLCNAHTLTTFTSISKHEHFIKQYLKYIINLILFVI